MFRKSVSIVFLIIVILAFKVADFDSLLSVPKHFPTPTIPKDNQLTIARVKLGKKLFFDPIMSKDRTLSCSSCHHPEKAFTDGEKTSIGKGGKRLLRNAPTLINVAYQDSGLLFEGGVPSLEMQVLVPVQEHLEFDFSLKLIAERMKKDSDYLRLSHQAYDKVPSPFVITRAIASYERTLIQGNSRYDQFINGDSSALNERELQGLTLFFDQLECDRCHGGFLFTTKAFENNGLYNYPYPKDSGRMRLTHLEKDRDKFKVPTLRNIEITAPYMHDGSIKTLKEIVMHYENGGEDHPNKSKFIMPFELTNQKRENLVLFLKALTDKYYY